MTPGTRRRAAPPSFTRLAHAAACGLLLFCLPVGCGAVLLIPGGSNHPPKEPYILAMRIAGAAGVVALVLLVVVAAVGPTSRPGVFLLIAAALVGATLFVLSSTIA